MASVAEDVPEPELCQSGSSSDAHVEGDRLCVGVVIPGIAFQGERDRRQTVALRLLVGRCPTVIDVQCGHTVVPVAGLA